MGNDMATDVKGSSAAMSEDENGESGGNETMEDDDDEDVKLLQPINTRKQEVDEDFERELAALTLSNPAAAPPISQEHKQVPYFVGKPLQQ